MIKEIKKTQKKLLAKKPVSPIKSEDLLSSGGTTLNLACSDRRSGAYPKGKYVLMVGASRSGKTWLALTALAEAANNPEFDDYDLVYMPTEDGADMDKVFFFGDKLAKRIEIMEPESLEEFYYMLHDLAKIGKPRIVVLDSMDGFDSRKAEKQFEKERNAKKKGKEAGGSYGTDMAKLNSRRLRIARNKLKKTGSILIIISQARHNIGYTAMFEPLTRAGGDALTYFAHIEVWTSIRKKLFKKIRDKKIEIGTRLEAKVKKNRTSGKERVAVLDIYNTHGIDDTGSCVDYLIEWKHWSVKKGRVDAKEFEVTLPREALIKYIEEENLEPKLRKVVARVWQEVESECQVERKRRYE